MTERNTGPLSIFLDEAGNVPAPFFPPELPAAKDASGGAVAKRDRSAELPAPWVPAELPALKPVPAATSDRNVAKPKPWVPPAEAPRNLPAAVPEDAQLPVPKKQKKRDKRRARERSGELTENTGGGQIIVNIVNQVAAPAPVYVSPWWGCGCPNFSCPRHYGRSCWRVWCGWW